MPDNPHFEFPASLTEARELVDFEPVTPAMPGLALNSVAVFVRDHKHRDLPRGDRSLELDYEGFVFSQQRKGEAEARRTVVEVSFGRYPRETLIAGREGRVYALGPEPEPDDIDPRSPAVVVWQDAEMFYLIASPSLEAEALLPIAQSVYPP